MGSALSEKPSQIDEEDQEEEEEDDEERSETASEKNARIEKENMIQEERRKTKEKFDLLKQYQSVFSMKPKTMDDILADIENKFE